MNAITPAPLLSEEEAARWLGISPRTMRKLRHDGKIHYVLIRTAVRYTLADLSRFVEGARTCQSIHAPTRPTGGTHSPLGVADFAAARAKRKSAQRA